MSVLKKHMLCLLCQYRFCSNFNLKTSSWQISRYGGPEELKLNISNLTPISGPNDVLIRVHAASVNPIDVQMLNGFGSRAVDALRKIDKCSLNLSEFPLTFGRDFSGVVVDVGQAVEKVKPGDQVWGATSPEKIGSHAKYTVVDACNISHKPKTIDHTQAASLPFAALTAWNALCLFGGMTKSTAQGSRVLLLGGSGGVGIFSIQLLKAWGAEVTVICSKDAVEMLQNFGADYVLDYRSQDIKMELKQMDRFDFILDTVGGESKDFALDLLKTWRNCKYVTVVSPLLNYTDKYGIIMGSLFSAGEAAFDTLKGGQSGRSIRWAYFCPSGKTLSIIKTMVEEGKIIPVIDQVFSYHETPEAYRKVLAGHARGKTVIQVEN